MKLLATSTAPQPPTSASSSHRRAFATHTGIWRAASGVLLAASLFALGCNEAQTPQSGVTAGDVEKETGEALDVTAQLAKQERDEFIRATEQELAQLKSDLEALKQQAQAAQGKAKTRLDQQVSVLEEKWHAANAKMSALREKSAEAWQDLKLEVLAAVADLKESYQEVRRAMSQG